MILAVKVNSVSYQVELNFTTSTWNIPPALAKWGNVMHSDRGPFEVKTWGVMWLMDGQGSNRKECTIILHSAPTEENDKRHTSGTGVVYAPALAWYKDASIEWNVVRPSAPPELALGRASSDGLTKVRAKAKSIAESLLPTPGKLTNGKPEPGAKKGATACGEFPGRVLRRMPCKVPPARDAFELDVAGAGRLHLAAPTTHWENFAKAIDQKFKPARKTWVDFDGSKRPKTGDIYLLSKFENKAEFQHVGMIISASGSEWVTADAGQGNGWQSGFITRKFYPTGQIDGEFGNKAWLKGWVDLDNLREVLADYFPKELA